MDKLKEDKNYIYYENDIFSKSRQRFLKKGWVKKFNCEFTRIVILPRINNQTIYRRILLVPNYHINL